MRKQIICPKDSPGILYLSRSTSFLLVLWPKLSFGLYKWVPWPLASDLAKYVTGNIWGLKVNEAGTLNPQHTLVFLYSGCSLSPKRPDFSPGQRLVAIRPCHLFLVYFNTHPQFVNKPLGKCSSLTPFFIIVSFLLWLWQIQGHFVVLWLQLRITDSTHMPVFTKYDAFPKCFLHSVDATDTVCVSSNFYSKVCS